MHVARTITTNAHHSGSRSTSKQGAARASRWRALQTGGIRRDSDHGKHERKGAPVTTPSRHSPIPLVVDLDGTLIPRDSFLLLVGAMARRAPHRLPSAARMARQSRAATKHHLWEAVGLDVGQLRYAPRLLAHLEHEASSGRALILATGSTQALADSVAEHLGIFAHAIGSSRDHNLTGRRKAERLVADYGLRGFDYAGNSAADLAVWRVARRAIVCNAPRRVARLARQATTVIAEFEDRRYRGPGLQSLLAARASLAADPEPPSPAPRPH
jgi:phosphoserine phosphatase